MTVTTRKIAASPVRTASQAWDFITTLICHSSTSAKREFDSVAGAVCSIISEGAPSRKPIVIRGSGPLLRIYCLYDDDAISGDDVKESPVSWDPFEKKWTAYIPCDKEDLETVKKYFAGRSGNFEAYDVKTTVSFQKSEDSANGFAELEIDTEALSRL